MLDAMRGSVAKSASKKYVIVFSRTDKILNGNLCHSCRDISDTEYLNRLPFFGGDARVDPRNHMIWIYEKDDDENITREKCKWEDLDCGNII
uniref:Uncharacterized protein n=1 Tax=Rhizophagus irregularis (strain DAOM 181602 / DAOM 197198 / MUCL 43194) TaxID=747089 RepID=U9UU06_RHIID